jgi:LacI family transcriptional regulator
LGYREALEERGLPLCDFAFQTTPEKDGLTRELGAAVEADDRPTAFFAASDYVAIHFWDWLEKRGLRVPEDIALVGYGNSRFGRLVRCGLTTVDESKEAQNERAVEMLVERIDDEGPDRPRRQLVSTSLVARGSSSLPA